MPGLPTRTRTARRLGLLLVSAMLSWAGPALSAPWVIDPAASRIEITYREDGDPRTGTFDEFEGQGDYDPAQPEKTKLTLSFETASIRLEDPFRSEFVKTEAWFNSSRYAQARFVLDRLEHLEGDQFRALGTLTIKDHSQPIEFLLTLSTEDGLATAAGSVSFDRLDFGLGDLTGAFLIEIGRQIDVAFDLTARPE